MFNKLSGKDYYKIERVEGDILSNLYAFDLEELVILYLQIKHNYCVLSNSIANKSTTVKIECELMSRAVGDKKKAVVQVKGGNDAVIDALDYKDYADDGYTVYLYAPCVENADKVQNIVVISDDELRSFYDKYKGILPLFIRKWESPDAK